jgi:hypothetical protein
MQCSVSKSNPAPFIYAWTCSPKVPHGERLECRALPTVAKLVESRSAQTIFTRFIPSHSPEKEPRQLQEQNERSWRSIILVRLALSSNRQFPLGGVAAIGRHLISLPIDFSYRVHEMRRRGLVKHVACIGDAT